MWKWILAGWALLLLAGGMLVVFRGPLIDVHPKTQQSFFPSRSSPFLPQVIPVERHDPLIPTMDLNRATAEDLVRLPGVGPRLAGRLISYREKHGPFRSVEELTRIRGIGPVKVRAIRAFLRVEEEDVR